jgi:diguanylate cyclase (GGDEF)-like protein
MGFLDRHRSNDMLRAPFVWRSPEIPENIRPAIEKMQVARAFAHVPMIYSVAIINLLLVMLLCAHTGVALRYYGWMGFLAIASTVRAFLWVRQKNNPYEDVKPAKLLRNLTFVSVGIIGFLSFWSVFAISTEIFENLLFLSFSLVFGSTCIAHCLACIRKAAVATLVVGILPSAITLMIVGGMEEFIMGTSMVTITLLMVRFIIDSYNQIVSGLIMERQIWEQAHSDILTGIANRRAMMDMLDAAEADYRSDGHGYAIALLDLDGFKQVNDTLGHGVGDRLLQTVARRLSANAKSDEYVARLGGDEFLILMQNTGRDWDLDARMSSFLTVLAAPEEIDGHILRPSSSMGIAECGKDIASVEAMLKAADEALYAMKREQRANVKPKPAASEKAA